VGGVSAEALRETAKVMRLECGASVFFRALADWLDLVAIDGDNGYDESDDNYRAALVVARAYYVAEPE
jgi:hypothetical protein